MSDSSSDKLARQVRQHLESLRTAGVEWLPDAAADLEAEPPASSPESTLTVDERRHGLTVLAEEVSHCSLCAELASTRTQTVFGVGAMDPEICFIGEAPGADEDAQGEPFVGAAGQLLNRIIAACGLKREEVYIGNILKCRPPGNRTPLPNEATNCRPFLDRQLDLVRPRVIVCLGGSATKYLLSTSIGITKLRGQWREYRGIPVMCTYHPSYLLRLQGASKDAAKREVWEDMKKVLERVGRPVPGGRE